MRHRFVHRAGTLALTLLMVALSTLMVGAFQTYDSDSRQSR